MSPCPSRLRSRSRTRSRSPQPESRRSQLTVKGRASHAGAAPERGVNALYELSHQIMQARDLSDPATGMKLNWTIAKAGTNRNVIPPEAQAMADVRVLRVADYDAVEQKVRERIKQQLLPEAKVEMIFERRRPPLEASPASQAFAKHAQAVYKELGKDLVADAVAEGGGTDAAFAALATKNASWSDLACKASVRTRPTMNTC